MNLGVVICVITIGGVALHNCLTKDTVEAKELLKAIGTGSIIWWSIPHMFHILVRLSTVMVL